MKLKLGVTLIGAALVAGAQAEEGVSRGELLYTTHCVECHTSEIHWRDKKAATDNASLLQEVARWQAAANLGWSPADVRQVAGYLNRRYYHFPNGD